MICKFLPSYPSRCFFSLFFFSFGQCNPSYSALTWDFCGFLKLLKQKEHQAACRAGYVDRFGLDFFKSWYWQESAVYFGFLLKGAVCLAGEWVSAFGAAALAPDCGPRSENLASGLRGTSRPLLGHLAKKAGVFNACAPSLC